MTTFNLENALLVIKDLEVAVRLVYEWMNPAGGELWTPGVVEDTSIDGLTVPSAFEKLLAAAEEVTNAFNTAPQRLQTRAEAQNDVVR